jgi:hypothetical protein
MSYPKPLPKCTRCHQPAEYIWWARSDEAELLARELALCRDCVSIIRDLHERFLHKLRQKADAAQARAGAVSTDGDGANRA